MMNDDHEENRDAALGVLLRAARIRDSIVLEIASDDELAALCVAIGNAVGTPTEDPLTRLLRKLAPDHPVLVRLDRIVAEDLADEHADEYEGYRGSMASLDLAVPPGVAGR